jgi:TonB family protein
MGPGAGARGDGGGFGIPGPPGLGNGGGLRRVPLVAPEPPAMLSRARPPRAKHPYRRWKYRVPLEYNGREVHLELAIDARGNVSGVRVLRSVASDIDNRAVSLARRFEFYPALDDAGAPTAGIHRWVFVIESTVDFKNALGL